MLFISLFLLEIIILFFISRLLTQTLSRFLFAITKNHKAMVYIFAFIFLPGTIIHEVAHYLTALLLGVPSGNMRLFPKIEGNTIKLGSVMVAETNIFKRAIIGLAPLFFGVVAIVSVLFYIYSVKLYLNNWIDTIIALFLFEVSNNMYSSKKDLEGLWLFLLLIFVLFFIFIILVYKIHFLFPVSFIAFSKLIDAFLLLPIGINVSIILVLRGIFLLQK